MLQTPITEIQSALQDLSRWMGEAEHAISEVEEDFKETK